MGVRRLIELVAGLPADSAYGRALGDGWTPMERLAGETLRAVSLVAWKVESLHRALSTEPGETPEVPEWQPPAMPWDDPDDEEDTAPTISVAEAIGILRG